MRKEQRLSEYAPHPDWLQRVGRVSSAFSQADIQLDFWSPARLRLIADLICSERHRPQRPDSVEKLDVAAEFSVRQSWNFGALLFIRLQPGPDARFSCWPCCFCVMQTHLSRQSAVLVRSASPDDANSGRWTAAARVNSSLAPLSPRSRNRSSFNIRFRCANSISTFLRSHRDRRYSGVPAIRLATSRAASWMLRVILRNGAFGQHRCFIGQHWQSCWLDR